MANLANCKNKLLEFTEGYDGHCLRCAYFFKDELEDKGITIDLTSKDSVNSIKTLAPELRQESKPVSFSKQYGGGTKPIMSALKCSKNKAQQLSNTYDSMYPELGDFAETTVMMAKENGYVQGFFGLKLRCPDIKAEDKEATSKMGRTLTNMRVQSSAMLTVQAVMLLQDHIERAGLYKDIKINATIHDSIYLMIKPKPEVLEFVNRYLIEYMCLPYEGVIVPNEASLDIGSSWKELKGIPNHSDTLNYSELLEGIVC